MEQFGARLKDAREQSGVSLRQLSAATKISVAALEALERDDFSRLPGGIFGRAFVRAYAIEVGLDADKTVNEFVAELTRVERDAVSVAQRVGVTPEDVAFAERQRRAVIWLRFIAVIVLGLAVGVAVWWFRGR
jgi:cytoskeletal protein RodZ